MIKKKQFNDVGILGFGGYVPQLRVKVKEIAQNWGNDGKLVVESLGIEKKSVADKDEDTITMAWQAAQVAIRRAKINPQKIGAVFVGSESHPYAVKPSGTVLAQALGIGHEYFCVDLEFACKSATTGALITAGLIESGLVDYGLVVGSDTAQSRPGGPLEYTAASGAGALVLGSKKKALVKMVSGYSFNSDTPDFWRRSEQKYPEHGGRFTGKPGYFYHLKLAISNFLKKQNLKISDFDQVVLHMPNLKFPLKFAKQLGISKKQLKNGLIVKHVGNTYSACSILGLVSALENAKIGQKILVSSYGSGAGSDCIYFKTLKSPAKKLEKDSLKKQFSQTQEVSYLGYLKRFKAISK